MTGPHTRHTISFKFLQSSSHLRYSAVTSGDSLTLGSPCGLNGTGIPPATPNLAPNLTVGSCPQENSTSRLTDVRLGHVTWPGHGPGGWGVLWVLLSRTFKGRARTQDPTLPPSPPSPAWQVSGRACSFSLCSQNEGRATPDLYGVVKAE